MKEKQVIVTEEGLEIPRSTLLEKLGAKIVANRFGIAIANSTRMLIARRGLSDSALERLRSDLDDINLMHRIERDFKKGKIKGRVVPANDPSVHNFTPDETRLALAEYRLMKGEIGG